MLRNHGKGKITAINVNGKYQIHTKYEDGVECIEEWIELKKQGRRLVCKKWKEQCLSSNSSTEWQFEIGRQNEDIMTNEMDCLSTLKPTASNPLFYAEDSVSYFIWKIENCSWPVDNYIIEIDINTQCIKLKTKNKKYFKVFQIPSMSRLNMRLNKDDQHKFELDHDVEKNVLTILFRKPNTILEHERKEAKFRDEAIAKMHNNGDVECRQS